MTARNPLIGTKSVAEKIANIENKGDSLTTGSEEKSPHSSAAERLKAMRQHRLVLDMVDVQGPIPYSDFETLGKILSEYKKEYRYQEKEEKKEKWTQKKLVAHYVLEGIKRDEKKFKNN